MTSFCMNRLIRRKWSYFMYPLIRFWLYFLMESRSFPHIPEADLARGLPIFCNHFEELQTVLFEVEMIINCAVHYAVNIRLPNTIEKCLTLNHLLFERQLLYSPNTIWTVFRNLTVLSSTTAKLNGISNHFGGRWRHEYVVNLRATQ